jgi:hypothetical protein
VSTLSTTSTKTNLKMNTPKIRQPAPLARPHGTLAPPKVRAGTEPLTEVKLARPEQVKTRNPLPPAATAATALVFALLYLLSGILTASAQVPISKRQGDHVDFVWANGTTNQYTWSGVQFTNATTQLTVTNVAGTNKYMGLVGTNVVIATNAFDYASAPGLRWFLTNGSVAATSYWRGVVAATAPGSGSSGGNLIVQVNGSGVIQTPANFLHVNGIETVKSNEFNVMNYGAKGDGASDDLPAFQAAMNAIAANNGGDMIVPESQYGYNFASGPYPVTNLNSGTQWTYLQFPEPNMLSQAPMSIRIIGRGPPRWSANWTTNLGPLSYAGQVIICTNNPHTNAAIMGIQTPLSTAFIWQQPSLSVELQNLVFRTTNNSPLDAVNVGYISRFRAYNCYADKGSLPAAMVYDTSNTVAFRLPQEDNFCEIKLEHCGVMGFDTAFSPSEHAVLIQPEAYLCNHAFKFEGGNFPLTIINPLRVGCGTGFVWNAFQTVQILGDEFEHTRIDGVNSNAPAWAQTVYDLVDNTGASAAGDYFWGGVGSGGIGASGQANVTKFPTTPWTNFVFHSLAVPQLVIGQNTANYGPIMLGGDAGLQSTLPGLYSYVGAVGSGPIVGFRTPQFRLESMAGTVQVQSSNGLLTANGFRAPSNTFNLNAATNGMANFTYWVGWSNNCLGSLYFSNGSTFYKQITP